MRNWFVLFLVGTLFLLPFSGSSAAVMPHETMHETVHETMHSTHENMQSPKNLASEPTAFIELAPAVEHHMPEPGKTSGDHCKPEITVVEPVNHNHHVEIVESADHTQSSMAADCCDNLSDCGTKCPADCGHCVMFGHGCTAALNNLNIQTPILAFSASALAASFYSLLTSKPTPPPIIA